MARPTPARTDRRSPSWQASVSRKADLFSFQHANAVSRKSDIVCARQNIAGDKVSQALAAKFRRKRHLRGLIRVIQQNEKIVAALRSAPDIGKDVACRSGLHEFQMRGTKRRISMAQRDELRIPG